MLTFFYHFSYSMLYFFYVIYIFLKIWAPCLNTIFQLRSCKCLIYTVSQKNREKFKRLYL